MILSLVSPFQKLAAFQDGIQFEFICRLHQTPQVNQRALAKDLGVGLLEIMVLKAEMNSVKCGPQ